MISKATEELAKILSDGKWYNTHYLGMAAGKFVSPEAAYRIGGRKNVRRGQYTWIYRRLWYWWKDGKVERRLSSNGSKEFEWRLIKDEGVNYENSNKM